jgi:hypothetical protein
VATDGILEFKKPTPLPYRSATQKDLRLDTHILDLAAADNLVNIHPQKLMMLVLHPKAKRTDVPVGTADRDHIYRKYILLHIHPPRFSLL